MSASTASPNARTGRRRLRRVVLALVAAATLVGAVFGVGSLTASADGSSTYGTSQSRAAQVGPGSGVALAATSSSGVLTTLTSTLVNSLVNPVAALPTSTQTSVANTLTAAGYVANNPVTRQPRPSPDNNYPSCGQQGWDSTDCYAAIANAAPTLSSTSLVAVGSGTVQGYATGDDQGFIGAAGASHPMLAIPGYLIDLGVGASVAKCDTTPNCTATHSLSGGTITPTGATALSFSLASGSNAATVAGTAVPGATAVPVIGNAVTASANGNLLTLNFKLTLTQLLTALGTNLSALNSGLTGTLTDNNSTVTLSVTIGPGSISSGGTSSSAWGIDVGVNLSADIKLSIPGVPAVTVAGTVTTPAIPGGSTELQTTPGTTANLLALKFAYSQATSGTTTGSTSTPTSGLLPGWVAPAVV